MTDLTVLGTITRRSRYDVLMDGDTIVGVRQHPGSTPVEGLEPGTWHQVVAFHGSTDVMERMVFRLQGGVGFRTGIVVGHQDVDIRVGKVTRVLEPEAPAPAGPAKPWSNLPQGQCTECDRHTGGPTHFGSPSCKSNGAAAPGGYRTHCSCDACY